MSSTKRPANQSQLPKGGLGAQFQETAEEYQRLIGKDRPESSNRHQLPFYSTGARALIRLAGKPLGVAQNIRWTTSYDGEPLYTIDTLVPWDVEVGPLRVNAVIQNIIDPTKGPEVDTLFTTMAAAAHQPIVELQVLDKSGTTLFFARGMFLEVNGDISIGKLSTNMCKFTGIAYQHYVAQTYKPYSLVSGFGKLVGDAQQTLSRLTTGIL